MTTELRYLSPAETAERLGVSVKALRVYERRGMVTPMRTSAGWRVYGPEQIARLHQILALKSLGLSLSRIAELLAGKAVQLDGLLTLQEEALAAHRQRLDRALALLRTMRAKLKAGGVLSIDDLTTLAKETAMSDPMTDQEAKDLFEPLGEKYFTPQELGALKARNFGADEQTIATSVWAKLTESAKRSWSSTTLPRPKRWTSPAAGRLRWQNSPRAIRRWPRKRRPCGRTPCPTPPRRHACR